MNRASLRRAVSVGNVVTAARARPQLRGFFASSALGRSTAAPSFDVATAHVAVENSHEPMVLSWPSARIARAAIFTNMTLNESSEISVLIVKPDAFVKLRCEMRLQALTTLLAEARSGVSASH